MMEAWLYLFHNLDEHKVLNTLWDIFVNPAVTETNEFLQGFLIFHNNNETKERLNKEAVGILHRAKFV